MACEVRTTEKFERQAKRLFRKFPSLKKEMELLGNSLSDNPKQGTALGNNFYKIRLAIKSKGKGKSGGARVITYLVFNKPSADRVERIYLSAIYDKSEYESISSAELTRLISDIN